MIEDLSLFSISSKIPDFTVSFDFGSEAVVHTCVCLILVKVSTSSAFGCFKR